MAEKMAIQIRDTDDVATATCDLSASDVVTITGLRSGHEVAVQERIPAGHKIALREIQARQEIRKYGEVIGVATQDIKTGEWVHVHNCFGIKARRFAKEGAVTNDG